MEAPFAAAAHELRRRGLAVVPCPAGGKSPAGAYRFGTWKRAPGEKLVSEMIERHPGANVGMITDLSHKFAIVDVDFDVDDDGKHLQNEMVRRFGDTPLMTRTPSGGLHLWYVFTGERSTDLRKSEGIPVEIKTASSRLIVVVPPSINGHSGQPYWLLRGSWDDLGSLPAMNPDALPAPANDTKPKIREGRRNNALWRHCMRQARHCDDLKTLIDVARTFAGDRIDMTGTTHGITDADIVNAAASAWRYETDGRNLFGRGGAIAGGIQHHDLDALIADNADSVVLLMFLQRHHWGRDFTLVNNTAPALGWGLPRFRGARDTLVRHGHLRCIHRGGRGPGDPPRYRLLG